MSSHGGQARTEATRLAEAEKQVQAVRNRLHTAVRRLHLAGASLREVAQALAISHQRVQQIVGEAGGTWWQRAWRSRGAAGNLFCSGCGRPQSEVERLIAGPDVFICDVCVGVAERAISGHGQAGQPGVSGPRCSFCGCRQPQARLVSAGGQIRICDKCLATCRDILDASTSEDRRL